MSTVFKIVESLEIEFNSDEELENFNELITNPPEPSEFLKKLIRDYEEHGCKNPK